MALRTTAAWKYSDTTTSGWSDNSFDDSAWTAVVPGAFPAIASSATVRYYRTSVTVPTSLEGTPAFEIGIKTKYGFILYADGQEVYRFNLPADATSTTPCTETMESAAFRRISLPIGKLTQSVLKLAVEVHFAQEAEGNDEFAGFFALVAASSVRSFSGSYDSNHGSDIGSETMDMAFDDDLRTKWTAMSVPAYDTITFNDGRSEFINAYAVASSGGIDARQPSSWTLSGSNDGENWTILDAQEGVRFTGKYQYKVFTLAHNAASFRKYRINVLAAKEGTAIEVGNIRLLINPVTYSATPVLSYPSANLFVGQTIHLAPTQGGFHSFSISPSLPAGLTFSTSSGAISGTASSVSGSSTYQISAKHVTTGETSYSFSLSLAVVQCTDGKFRVDIVKHSEKQGSAEKWILKQGETVIDEQVGLDVFGSQSVVNEVYPYCLDAGVYSLTLSQEYMRGWYPSAYIEARIHVSDSETVTVLHHTQLNSEASPITVSFGVNLLSNADATQWQYKADGTIPNGWNTASFTETWPAVPATAPSVSQNVWLFRRQITVSATTSFDGFVMRTKARGGVVVYLNGAEVFRTNVEGAITASSTATSAEDQPVWRTFSGVLGTGGLTTGQNTFAVALVNADASSLTLDAQFVIHLIAGASLSLGLESDVSDSNHNSDAVVANNMFHGDYSKQWQATWRSQGHYATVTFKHGSKHLVNKYCMVSSWDTPMANPMTWKVSTSTDGTTFTDKITESKILFSKPYTRACFYLPGVTEPLRALRFTVTEIAKTTQNMQLDAIDLYYVDASQAGSLSYSMQSALHVGADIEPIAPSSTFFYDFEVTPALPAGLVLQSNGVIRGRPTAAATQQSYTLRAKSTTGSQVSAQLSLTVEDCGSGMTLLSFMTGNTEDGGTRMQVHLRLSDGSTAYYNYNIPNYQDTIDVGLCLPKDVFIFTLLDNTNDGWKASYTIRADHSLVAQGNVAETNSPKTVTTSTLVFIEESQQTFKYQVENVEADSTWYLPSTTLSWPEGTTGSLPSVNGITSRYCTHFQVTNMDLFAAYSIEIKTKGGFIAYMNGEEINRVNLADDASVKTTATKAYTASRWVYYSMGMQSSNLVVGDNYLCVEVHKSYSNSNEPNDFNVVMSPKPEGIDLIANGSYRSSHPGLDDGQWHETNANIFDKNTGNKFYAKDSSCKNVWVEWAYENDRREFVTRFVFFTGNGRRRMPHKVDLHGINGDSKELLLTKTITPWDCNYGDSLTYDFLPSKPYNKYLFTFNGCDTEGIEMGELYLYNYRASDLCPRTNGIPAVLYNQYSSGPCPEGYQGTISYLCDNGEFVESARQCLLNAPKDLMYEASSYAWHAKETITPITPTFVGESVKFSTLPTLPEGLSVDQSTGTISGKPKTAAAEMSYTVFCKNEGGSTKTKLMITILEAKTPVWLYVLIVVIIIALVAVIIFVVKNKGTGGKKKKIKTLSKSSGKQKIKKAETTTSDVKVYSFCSTN